MSGWFPGKIALVAKVRAILSDYRADYKEAKHLARRRQVTDETINKLVALFADTGAAPASGWHGQGPMSTTDDCRASGMNSEPSSSDVGEVGE